MGKYWRVFVVFQLVMPILGLAAQTADPPSQPNIVLVLLDNFGWGEPGFNGGGGIRGAKTPRLDQIAAEGLRLTNFNVEVQCTPSRAALLTGRYAVRTGNGVVPVGDGIYGLVGWEQTLAESLSGAGYATGIFGKWHLGRTEGRYPTDQGFDEWFGIPNSTDEATYAQQPGFTGSGVAETSVMRARRGELPEIVRPYRMDYRGLIDADITEAALDFMRRKAALENPFFLYVPYTATHYPVSVHPDFSGLSGNGTWADMLLQIDSYVGQLLDEVDRLGIASETLFIFTADNGPEAFDHGSTNLTVETAFHGSAGPWRGTLFTGFEGALRVPFAARWPGTIEAGRSSDEIVHVMDLFPTLAALAGSNVPDDRPIDGIDMADFLLGETDTSGRDGFVVYMGNEIFGIKWRNWKLHFKEQASPFAPLQTFTLPRVYNLWSDPQERDNVLFPATWVTKAAFPILEEHVKSLKVHPPIAPGTPDPYAPGQ